MAEVRYWQHAPGVRPAVAGTSQRSANPVAAWLILLGLLVPPEFAIRIAGAKLTPGRVGIVILLIPAILLLFEKSRRFVWADLFVCATAIWMVTSQLQTAGVASLASPLAEALELLGGYFVARAFFFGRGSVETFARVLRSAILIMIFVAVVEHIAERNVIRDFIAGIFSLESPGPTFRHNLLRATSTIDNAILYGTICAVAVAIFLYSDANPVRRYVFAGIGVFGCFLSMSSAPILSMMIVLATYTYDAVMRDYSWRWKALWAVAAAAVGAFCLVSNNPVGWFVSHLTLDPASGYYRWMTWDAAFRQIAMSPILGFHFYTKFDDHVLNSTVDSVWLVYALRFGIPMIAFLFLANLAAAWRGENVRGLPRDVRMDRLRTGFTLALVVFIFAGLTVHYWNYIWIFWGVCIGIRASLREHALARMPAPARRRPIRQRPVNVFSR